MRLRPADPSGDKGASAVFVAITLVFLMGVAAVVIDGGVAFSERRQAQAAVDFAALAALQASIGSNPADAGALEVQAVVAANLPGRTLDWTTCTDPNRPIEYSIISSITECISFTGNFGQARVRLPTDAVDTTFGRIIGFNSIDVRTVAEAEQTSKASADILPYTAGSGSIVCLFSNQAPQTVPPCDGPNSGFFGYLDVALYGSSAAQLDNPWTCANGTSNVRSAINIAKGSDHIMVEWDPGDPVVNDHAECANKSEDVNELVVQPGDPTQGTDNGLIHGVSGQINSQAFGAADGRLEPTDESVDETTVRGELLDNTPLWSYLLDPSCGGSPNISGNVDNADEMIACLDEWGGGTIFKKELEDHRRFGAVPIFTMYPNGPGSYRIDHFSPVWIQTIYQNCNANRCHTIFSPGEVGGTNGCPPDLEADPVINCGHSHTQGPDDVEGVTAFQMKLGMLDPETQLFFPGGNSLREINLLR